MKLLSFSPYDTATTKEQRQAAYAQLAPKCQLHPEDPAVAWSVWDPAKGARDESLSEEFRARAQHLADALKDYPGTCILMPVGEKTGNALFSPLLRAIAPHEVMGIAADIEKSIVEEFDKLVLAPELFVTEAQFLSILTSGEVESENLNNNASDNIVVGKTKEKRMAKKIGKKTGKKVAKKAARKGTGTKRTAATGRSSTRG